MTPWFSRYLPQILAALLAVALLKLSCIDLQPSGILFAEDQALWFATAQRLLDGDFPLLGPPSHVGGRHLGAIVYAVAAGCLLLAQGDLVVATRLLAVLSLVSILLLCLLIQRLVVPSWKWWSAVIVLTLACSGEMVQVVRTPWHGHLLVLFVMGFMWASHALFTEGVRRAPIYLLTATLLIQTHYAALPLVAVFTLVWLARLRSPLYRAETRAEFRSLWTPTNIAFLSLTGAVCAPVLAHDLTYGQNTLLSILLNAGASHAEAGLRSAIVNMGYFFRLFLAGGQGFKELWDDSRVTVYATLVLSSVWFFARGRAVIREDSRRWLVALLLSVPAYILATARQADPLRTYYLYSLIALPFIFAVVASNGMFLALRRSLAERTLTLVCVVLWGLSVRFGIMYFDRSSTNGGIARYSSLHHGIEVGEILKMATRELSSTETHTILGRGSARITKDAYLYQLGPEYFGQINFSDRLREVSAFSNKPSSPYAFLMVCPNPPPHHARAMWRELKKKWQKRSEVDLSTCSTCRDCRMWVLEERAPESGL